MAGNFLSSSTTQNPPMGFDFQAEMEKVARKKKLVDQLVSQGVTDKSSPVIDAGMYKVANWSDPMKHVVNSIVGAYMGSKADDETQDLSQKYNQRMSEGLKDYLTTKGGGERSIGQDTRALDESGDTGAAPTATMSLPADPRGAAVKAITSNIAPLQQIGMQDLQQMGKNQMTQENWLKLADHYDVPSIQAAMAANNPALLKPKGNFHMGEGYGVTEAGGQVTGKTPITNYGQPGMVPGTNVPGQQETGTGKYTGITGGNPTPATHQENVISDVRGKMLEKGAGDYQTAGAALKSIAQMQTDMDGIDPSRFGTGANLKQTVSKLSTLFGASPDQQTGMMANFKQGVGQLVLENAKKVAPVTEKDLDELRTIMGSETDPKAAVQRSLEYLAKVNAATMDRHRNFVAGFKGTQGLESDDAFEAFRQQMAPDFQFTAAPPAGYQPPSAPFQRDPSKPDPLGLFGGQ